MVTVPAELPPLVDRQEEVARIAEALEAAERGEGQLLLLRGEAGCGKTRLVQEAVAQAARRGLATGFGTALSESAAPYYPWKEALEELGLGYILGELPPPKLLALYAITGEGAIAAKVERGENGPPVDVASALSAFTNAARPEMRVAREGPLSFVDLGPHRAVMHRADRFGVVATIEGREDEAFLSDLKDLVGELESSRGKPPGPGEESEDVPVIQGALLRRLLETGKYDGIDYVRSDPKQRQARLFDQVVLGLLRKAETSPQLVAIDDLQWADPSTLALLHHVARSLQRSRVLLMGAYRVEEAGARPHLRDALAKMEQDRQPAGLLVGGLPRDEMRRLVEVFLGPHALPGDFLEALWRETQGYPLFIREVLRGLEDDGAIRLRGAAKRLERTVDQLAIPTRVREAIRLRLEKLPKDERRLLDAAAACGTRFTSALLARVAGEEEGTVLRGLENLARVHGLLRATGTGFGFDHPAIQEVAYEASPPEARRAHHLEAAAWLDLVGGPVEDVADHLYRAGEPRAVPKLREAAEGARARYANAEAIRFYNEALSLETDSGTKRQTLEALGSLYRLIGDHAAGLAAYTRALVLAETDRERARTIAETADILEKTGEYGAAMKACLDALPLVEGRAGDEEASLLSRIGNVYSRQGEYEQALDYHVRSLAIHEKIGDQAGIASSLNSVGNAHHSKGEHERALEYYERSLAIHEKIGDQAGIGLALNSIGNVHKDRGEYARALEYLGRSLAVHEKIGNQGRIAASLNNIGNVYEEKGEYTRALEYFGRGLKIHEKIGDKMGVGMSLGNLGNVHHYRGEYARALEYYERSLAICEKIGDQEGIAWCLCNIGTVHHERGESDRALEYLRRGLAVWEKIGDQGGIAVSLISLAEAILQKGDPSNAELHCERALSIGTQIEAEQIISEARRVRGMVRRRRKRWEESTADFEESLRILVQAGRPFEEGRTHHEFGLMWNDRGDGQRAREHLYRGAQIFERVGAKGQLRKAREALRALP